MVVPPNGDKSNPTQEENTQSDITTGITLKERAQVKKIICHTPTCTCVSV